MVVLLQSEEVLFRPRCLLELYVAATAGIPIVSLACSGKGYDFAAAEDYLLHLDTSLPAANVSAAAVLEANDAPVLRVAHVLWACIPNIISVPLNSSGSENAIRAAVADLVKAMQRATAIPAPADDASWLESREARDGAVLVDVIESSMIRGTQRGRMLQKIERVEKMGGELRESRAALEVALAQVASYARDSKAARSSAQIGEGFANNDDERGILGGMYEFVPDREASILGKGASSATPRQTSLAWLAILL